jgi:hypothetical protein
MVHLPVTLEGSKMMNKKLRPIFIGAALAMALAACQKSDAPAVVSNGAPPESVSNAAPIPQFAKGDPSVPDASKVFAAQDAEEKAKLAQDVTTLQQKAEPQEAMTRTEEAKAMPLPGQANDHSTTALDNNKGG